MIATGADRELARNNVGFGLTLAYFRMLRDEQLGMDRGIYIEATALALGLGAEEVKADREWISRLHQLTGA